jgi:hypothetical protein
MSSASALVAGLRSSPRWSSRKWSPSCRSNNDAGGRSPIYPNNGGLRALLNPGWPRTVSGLFGIADRGSWLSLCGELDSVAKLPGPTRLLDLQDTYHNHFCDGIDVGHAWFKYLTMANADKFGIEETDWVGIARTIPPFDELVDPEAAYAIGRCETVAHLDATLRSSSRAGDLLAHHLVDEAARVGACALTVAHQQLT